MKILITGGTGLLGSVLSEALIKKGHELILLTRDRTSAGRHVKFPCELLQWDADSPALKTVEVFIHLAGENIAEGRWTPKRKKALRDSRILTAESAISKLKRANAKINLVITSSAMGIYGDCGDEELTEGSSPAEDFIGRLCQDWEAATRTAFPESRWCALRTSPVLSNSGGYLEKVIPIFKTMGGSNLGDGKQFMSWIHQDDWLRLAVEVVEDENLHGPINLTSPHPLRNSAWTRALIDALHTFRNFPVPRFALKVAFGELAELMMASQRVIPQKALNRNFQFHYPDAKSAFTNLILLRVQA